MNATAALSTAQRPLLQTLDMLTPSQQRAIRAIAPHDAAPVPAIEARRPVAMFTGEEFHALEQARLFRRQAVPITISARIAEPGSSVAHDGYGVPLLVTRDKGGRAHVFLNACTHKGAKLLDGCEVAKGNRLVCPYHAWTFSTDGSLVGPARPETFLNFDKTARGLAELPSREAGGIIWAMLDRHAPPDFTGVDQQLAEDLAAFELPDLHVYGHKQFHLNANWKVVLEPFLEGYHVQRLHAATVGPLFADVPNVVDKLGLNIRQISGKMNFTPDCLDIPDENIHASVTHAYNVFPNCVIVTSPYYISVMFLMPNGVDRTTVDYFMLTRRPPDNPKGAELYRKSYEMIVSVFGGEDFYAAELSQAGLKTGAIDEVVYSGLEATIPIYYEILDSVLAA
jgi:phenylpropionate dioxygenase-like ring-hydroxylating dioxygenase large terminal subunit